MNAFCRAGAIFLGFAWVSLSLVAQQPAVSTPAAGQPQPSSTASPKTNDRQLLLDVVVTGKSGKPVPGLHPQDFTVLDDRQPSKILLFHPHSIAAVPPSEVDASTEVILVLDEVNAPYAKVAYARQGIESFLKQKDGNLDHPVSLAFLTNTGLQLQTQPSIDGNVLATALEQQTQAFRTLEAGTGYFGAEQRLKLSIDTLEQLIAREQTRPGRKMVIWVSPGWPLLSGPGENLSSGEMQHIFGSVVRLNTTLQQARITLYSIDTLGTAGVGTSRTTYYENFTKGLTKPGDAALADLSLQVLDTQTGGRAIFGNDTIENSIDHCITDLDAFYTLSIEAAPAQRPNQYHELEIKLEPPNLKARTRTGYYAQP